MYVDEDIIGGTETGANSNISAILENAFQVSRSMFTYMIRFRIVLCENRQHRFTCVFITPHLLVAKVR